MKSQPPRILWITEHYPPNRGGMAESCDRITRGLRQADHMIDILHLRPENAAFKTREQVSGRYLSRPLDADTSHSLNLIWNELEAESYTHVFAFGGLLAMQAGQVFAAWLDASFITMFRGNDLDSGLFSLKNSPILHEALRRSRAACVVGADKQRKLSALYPDLEVLHTPNGIDAGRWQASGNDALTAEKLRANLLGDASQVWGLFGQIKKKKGGLFLLKNLRRTGRAREVRILVTGDICPEMTDYLERFGADFNITRLPFLDRFELIPYYLGCDFVAIPSFYDGMPNVMLEAGALGIPMLMSDAGGLGDWTRDGVHGIQFHAGNPDQCRDAIHRALDSSSEDRAVMGRNIQSLVSQTLGAPQEIDRYQAIIARTMPAREPHFTVIEYPTHNAATS